VYIEFVKWLLHLAEELQGFGDFMINGGCQCWIKPENRGLEVFEASRRMRFNHGCKSRIL
jgi:hypothetical protein